MKFREIFCAIALFFIIGTQAAFVTNQDELEVILYKKSDTMNNELKIRHSVKAFLIFSKI